MRVARIVGILFSVMSFQVFAQSSACVGVSSSPIEVKRADGSVIRATLIKDPHYLERSCELNSYSYHFIDMIRAPEEQDQGIWYSSGSVEEHLKADKWYKITPDKASPHDVVITRNDKGISGVFLIKSSTVLQGENEKKKNKNQIDYLFVLSVKKSELVPHSFKKKYSDLLLAFIFPP